MSVRQAAEEIMPKQRPLKVQDLSPLILNVLDRQDVVAVDRAVKEAGPEGQVHLVLGEGRLCCIRILKRDVLRGRPYKAPARD